MDPLRRAPDSGQAMPIKKKIAKTKRVRKTKVTKKTKRKSSGRSGQRISQRQVFKPNIHVSAGGGSGGGGSAGGGYVAGPVPQYYALGGVPAGVGNFNRDEPVMAAPRRPPRGEIHGREGIGRHYNDESTYFNSGGSYDLPIAENLVPEVSEAGASVVSDVTEPYIEPDEATNDESTAPLSMQPEESMAGEVPEPPIVAQPLDFSGLRAAVGNVSGSASRFLADEFPIQGGDDLAAASAAPPEVDVSRLRELAESGNARRAAMPEPEDKANVRFQAPKEFGNEPRDEEYDDVDMPPIPEEEYLREKMVDGDVRRRAGEVISPNTEAEQNNFLMSLQREAVNRDADFVQQSHRPIATQPVVKPEPVRPSPVVSEPSIEKQESVPDDVSEADTVPYNFNDVVEPAVDMMRDGGVPVVNEAKENPGLQDVADEPGDSTSKRAKNFKRQKDVEDKREERRHRMLKEAEKTRRQEIAAGRLIPEDEMQQSDGRRPERAGNPKNRRESEDTRAEILERGRAERSAAFRRARDRTSEGLAADRAAEENLARIVQRAREENAAGFSRLRSTIGRRGRDVFEEPQDERSVRRRTSSEFDTPVQVGSNDDMIAEEEREAQRQRRAYRAERRREARARGPRTGVAKDWLPARARESEFEAARNNDWGDIEAKEDDWDID